MLSNRDLYGLDIPFHGRSKSEGCEHSIRRKYKAPTLTNCLVFTLKTLIEACAPAIQSNGSPVARSWDHVQLLRLAFGWEKVSDAWRWLEIMIEQCYIFIVKPGYYFDARALEFWGTANDCLKTLKLWAFDFLLNIYLCLSDHCKDRVDTRLSERIKLAVEKCGRLVCFVQRLAESAVLLLQKEIYMTLYIESCKWFENRKRNREWLGHAHGTSEMSVSWAAGFCRAILIYRVEYVQSAKRVNKCRLRLYLQSPFSSSNKNCGPYLRRAGRPLRRSKYS